MLLSVCGHVESQQRKEPPVISVWTKIFKKPHFLVHVCKCWVFSGSDQGTHLIQLADLRVAVPLRRLAGLTPLLLTPPPPSHPSTLMTLKCIKRFDWDTRVLRGQSGLTIDQIHTLTCTRTRSDKMFPKAWSFSDLSLIQAQHAFTSRHLLAKVDTVINAHNFLHSFHLIKKSNEHTV